MSRIPYATAGSRPLCVYRNTDTGAVCGEENAGECPIRKLDGEGCDISEFTNLDQGKITDGTLEAVLIDKTLNIFQSTGPREVSTADCVNDVARLKEELDVNGVPEEGAIIEILRGAKWISKMGIGAIAQRLGIDVHPLHHYSVTYGNMVLWTTRVSDPADCPCNEPWLEDPAGTECTESGQMDPCVRSTPENADNHALWPPIDPDSHEAWLDEEISTYVPRRKEWGRKMRRLVVALGALTGSIPRVRMAGWYFRQRGSGQINYRSSELYTDGAVAPGVWVRMVERDFADEPLTCIYDRYDTEYNDDDTHSLIDYERDPDLGFCHVRDVGGAGDTSYGMFRFEFPLEYELDPNGEATLADFWGTNILSTFLGGTYDGVGERWRLRSPYMDDLIVRAQTNSNQDPELVFVEGNRTTDWQNQHNHGKDPYNGMAANIFGTTAWPIEDHINPSRMLDLLEFACQVSSRSVGPVPDCDASDPSRVPFVDSKKDIDKLIAYLQCASNDVQRVVERIIIPNLPNKLVEGFQKNGLEGLYGEYAGENLKSLLAIEDNLRDLQTAGDSIKTILHEASIELNNVKLEAENLDHRKVIQGLRTTQGVLQAAIGGYGTWTASNVVTGVAATVSVLYAAVAILEVTIGIFEQRVLENQENQNYNQAMLAFSAKMGELKGVFNGIADVYSSIQANLATLDQNQNRAVGWWAMGMGLDGDAAGHVYPVNTVMRRRLNTLRVRYERAQKRAKKLAFIARRAIEFRLGVDMSQMHNEMTLVPAPASWADRICDMQGFDYDRLRDAYPEDEELLDPELQGSDNYAHWYIGDYVTLLSDFVESYNLDHPFTDERDIAVISVKDDLMRARAQCEVPSRNLLYYSEDIGENRPLDDGFTTSIVGWQPGGCAPDPDTVINCVLDDPEDPEGCLAVDRCVHVYRDVEASAHCGPDLCYGYNPASVDSSTMALPHAADLLVDVPIPAYRSGRQSGRTEHWVNSGYYEQIVSGVPSGDYVLSWWARHPRDLATAPQDYRVEVRETIVSDGAQYPTVHENVFAGSQNGWRRQKIMFRLEQGQDLRVRIHPSDRDDTYEEPLLNPVFGAIWIWGVQLERVYCPDGDCSEVEPDAYQRNTSKVTVTRRVCPDSDGAVMRQDFEYKCVCLGYENGICPEGSEGSPDKQCFWEYPFELLLSRIESGDLIPSNNIAIGNFNYRHEALAVNVVGTNVLDCTNPQATSNCYTNAFVPYTLQHMGWVEVKNHERKTMEFSMPIARIEHGKGLSAEVVLTNPVTGTHSALLSEYWKDGLRGRPIQGQYMLRIWDTGDVVWSRIEDIQIVWKYRYWTQMSGY
jgi:hypothetical protein